MVVHLEDLELLKLQHSEWDKLLKKEQSSPSSDPFLIRDYKKHKLKVKEQIQKTQDKLFKGLDKS